MPDFAPYTKWQLQFVLESLEKAIYTPVAPLKIEAWHTIEPVPFAERCSGERLDLSVGDRWGNLFDSAWFRFTGQVPAQAAGEHVVLLLDVNGEMCVVDEQGAPLQGLTNAASGYDFRLGRPGKRVFEFCPQAQGGELIDLWADAGCNDLFGNLQQEGRVCEATVAICHDEVYGLYYDFEVLFDLLAVLSETSASYAQILRALTDVAHMIRYAEPESALSARRILAPLLARRGGDPALRITAIGHAHMDLAWLWPIRETIRKGARTFSTALQLMDHYPHYVFGASQAQYYHWMKEHYPSLYERIKARVHEGRIEPQGAMWVEADTNISGGEALVRQILQGKRFFRDEFGIEVRNLWLPDVFGYTAALPQILARARVDYFTTQKLSWSLINVFPHHSFHWQGIDGSSVLTHMLPEETYNSPAAPRSVRKIEDNYKDKDISTRCLMLFGIGDGGGGPGVEHLERLQRIENLSDLCPVVQAPAADFFQQWAQDAARFPTWVGELYLERHQGTLTTQARNKRYNRCMELALREFEWVAVVSTVLAGEPYPASRLQTIWREILLYQFHDILPGSSIKRVYDESVPRYQALYQELQERIGTCCAALADRVNTTSMEEPILVWNALSWPREEWVAANGRWVHAQVPPMGYRVLDLAAPQPAFPHLEAVAQHLENDLLRVTFHTDGSLASVHDKRAGREVLAAGKAGNRLAVYDDYGDAWDFPMDYRERAPRYMELVSSATRVEGPRAILEQIYRLGYSELRQKIVLTAGSARLDFVTHLSWREPRTMLRTSFPLAIHAEQASYDIQFGHIQRPVHHNTTWDLARDEVAAHKWVDLSQHDYGVALLNDSKYGHRIKDNVIDLNLLRSVPYPGPRLVADDQVAPGEPHGGFTDQCDHTFTYALYPHRDGLVAGGVVQAAYALNVPLRTLPAPAAQAGALPAHKTFLELDTPYVVIEAVKKAEDGDDLIVRLYECAHGSVHARLKIGFPVRAAAETNLLEEDIRPLAVYEGVIELDLDPFEIKTVRLVL